MKVLLSAYACEPNKGSEPGVGWDWAQEIAKNHKIWVLTRDNNRPTIDAYLRVHPELKSDNITFLYVGLPKWKTFWKKGRRGMRAFYMMWQKEAYRIATDLHKEIGFNIVHHITFVSYTQPTYLYKLGIPMIWGPIAGGDNLPETMAIPMSRKERIEEWVRSISQKMLLRMPSTQNTLKKSSVILTATEATKSMLPEQYHRKTFVMPAIGINHIQSRTYEKNNNKKFRIIVAGRLVYLKGYELAIEAFKKVASENDNVELSILGNGPLRGKLEKQAGDFLNKQIFFVEAVPHDEIFDFYKSFDLYMSTALRDSGCMTMLEAMSVGVPAVCISSGGPKVLSHRLPELQVEPKSNQYVIDELAKVINKMVNDLNFYREMEIKTLEACNEFLFKTKMEIMDELYLLAMSDNLRKST